jgi:hypothetical protein
LATTFATRSIKVRGSLRDTQQSWRHAAVVGGFGDKVRDTRQLILHEVAADLATRSFVVNDVLLWLRGFLVDIPESVLCLCVF